MERLTRKSQSSEMVWFIDHDNNGLNLEPCEMSYSNNGKAIRKLAYYEDAEEQGRLIVLPCKFGTTVYFIAFDKCYNGKCCWLRDGKCIKADSPEYCPKEVLETKYSIEMYANKTRVFLTREEAEAALDDI